MSNKVAIIQSNYIPWKGYFDIINQVDHFVFLDSAQYTVRDWRNRNKLKSAHGIKWLTIPNNGTQSVKINQVKIDNSIDWRNKHLNFMEMNYAKGEYFCEVYPIIRSWYYKKDWEGLSDFNQFVIKEICWRIGINTKFHNSDEFDLIPGKNENIIHLLKQLNGDLYLSGPAALDYLKSELFAAAGIDLKIMDYSNYSTYNQPWQEFFHHVSILDLLFCRGWNCLKYLTQITTEQR